eukprot:25218_1
MSSQSSPTFQLPTEQELNRLSVPELKQIALQLDIPYKRNTHGTTLRLKINNKRNSLAKSKTNTNDHTEIGCKRTCQINDDADVEECNPKKKPKLNEDKTSEIQKVLQSEKHVKQETSDANISERDADNATENNLILIDFYPTHKYQCYCRHPIRCPVLQENDTYEFVREPNNHADSNAIAIYGLDTNDKVGYIPRDIAYTLAPLVDAGKLKLKHGDAPCCTRACQVFVSVIPLTDEVIPSFKHLLYLDYDDW